MQTLHVQFKHVEIIAIGMQGRDAQLRAFITIIFVIIVGADGGDAIRAEDVDQPAGERAFAGGAISYDGKDDGSVFVHYVTFLRSSRFVDNKTHHLLLLHVVVTGKADITIRMSKFARVDFRRYFFRYARGE